MPTGVEGRDMAAAEHIGREEKLLGDQG
uniref:Uncharacterized protein n=1 Tax=Arundo donax TaxID=35708 RepID=A0A0A9CPM5_ARUDO